MAYFPAAEVSFCENLPGKGQGGCFKSGKFDRTGVSITLLLKTKTGSFLFFQIFGSNFHFLTESTCSDSVPWSKSHVFHIIVKSMKQNKIKAVIVLSKYQILCCKKVLSFAYQVWTSGLNAVKHKQLRWKCIRTCRLRADRFHLLQSAEKQVFIKWGRQASDSGGITHCESPIRPADDSTSLDTLWAALCVSASVHYPCCRDSAASSLTLRSSTSFFGAAAGPHHITHDFTLG